MSSYVYSSNNLHLSVKNIDVLAPLNVEKGQDQAAFQLTNRIASIREKNAEGHGQWSTILEVDVPETGGSIQKLAITTLVGTGEIVGEEFYFDYFKDRVVCRFSYFKPEGGNYELNKTVEKVESISQVLGINERYPLTSNSLRIYGLSDSINLRTNPIKGLKQSITNKVASKLQPLPPLQLSLSRRMMSIPRKFLPELLSCVSGIRSSDITDLPIQEVVVLDGALYLDESNHFQVRVQKEGKTYIETFQKVPKGRVLHYTCEVDGKEETATYAYRETSEEIQYVRVPRADKLEEALNFAKNIAGIKRPCTIANVEIERADHEGAIAEFCVVWDEPEEKIFVKLDYDRQCIFVHTQRVVFLAEREVQLLLDECTAKMAHQPQLAPNMVKVFLSQRGWELAEDGRYWNVEEAQHRLNFFLS